jgi:MFS family permease
VTPALVPIFLIVAVDVLGMTMILPLLPFYAERFRASPSTIGLLVATFAACQLISGPLLGALSDRVGRRPLLVVSQLGTLGGFVLLSRAGSIRTLFAARALDGITAGNLSLAQAYIADVTAPRERARAFSLVGVAFGLGFLIGPALAAHLARYNELYPIYAAEGLSACSLLGTLLLLPRSTAKTSARANANTVRTFSNAARDPALANLLLQLFAFQFAFALFTSGFALFAERRVAWRGRPIGPSEVGWLLAYAGLLGIALQSGVVAWLARRLGDARLARAGFVVLAGGYALLGAATSVPALAGALTLASLGAGALRPTLTGGISRRAAGAQGAALGLAQSLASLAQVVAPLVAGALIGRGALSGWALVAATAALAGLLLSTVRRAG